MSDVKKPFLPPDYKIIPGPTPGVEADGPEDHARAMEALDKLLAFEKLRVKSARDPGPQQAPYAPQAIIGGGATPHVKSRIRSRLKDAFTAHIEQIEQLARLDKTSRKPGSTISQRKLVFEDFVQEFGNCYLDEVMPEDLVLRWKKAELERPNRKKPGERLSAKTIQKRQQYLSAFFGWATKELRYPYEFALDDPIVDNKLVKSKANQYKEFTEDDLSRLFSPAYAAEMGKQPGWYWCPLIALFSGARRGEIIDRKPSDFEIVEGVKVFRISTGKTANSIRTIPIHSKLLALGLWEYVEYLKANGHELLFPGRPADDEEKSLETCWPKWVKKSGISEKGKVFHSFRSTAITDMHSNSQDHEAMRRTTGHSSAGVRGTHGDYVRGAKLERLVQAVEALKHPTVSIDNLRLQDPTFSAYIQRVTSAEYQARKARDRLKRQNNLAAKQAREKRMGKVRPAG